MTAMSRFRKSAMVSRSRDGHGHANAANMVQGRRPRRQLMMVSIQSQHGEILPQPRPILYR